MRVPAPLADAFRTPNFEQTLERFLRDHLAEDAPDVPPGELLLRWPRFLSRSVAPHVEKLSQLFNRPEATGLDPYWKASSNPENLRLAYFLYFMPANAFRVASVWAELSRLGYRLPKPGTAGRHRLVDLGAGSGAVFTGVRVGEAHASLGLSEAPEVLAFEQDRKSLRLLSAWLEAFSPEWSLRPNHRKLDFKEPLLPKGLEIDAFFSSFFLNELSLPMDALAQKLTRLWLDHLREDGIIVLVEPALRTQSRRLLELRDHLIKLEKPRFASQFQVLLPCLGHQACGALGAADDWCHEDVLWWRPDHVRRIDQMVGLDRKSLPFSYLVITRSRKPREEILPALAHAPKWERLVSPAHLEGQDSEFFICGDSGKRRARMRVPIVDRASSLERGDLLGGAQIEPDTRPLRISKAIRLFE